MNPHQVPPLNELFTRAELLRRNPRIPSDDAIRWALRKRATNGLANAVFKSRSGSLWIHEPTFLRWFFRLPMPELNETQQGPRAPSDGTVRMPELNETRKEIRAPLDDPVRTNRRSYDPLF